MKKGLSFVELASEIERQAASKKDYLASTTAMGVEVIDDEVKLRLGTNGDAKHVGINGIAHQQIATHTGIPQKYYDKMKAEAPDLLASNVDRWFQKYPATRMARTLDSTLRAFLSNTYRPLENEDLANAVLPILLEQKLEIMSAQITETRLYIKAVDPRIQKDVPSGRKLGDGSHVFFDTCSPAIIVSNSEVGFGRLSVDYGIFTRACTNLATIADGGMKRRHVGARNTLTDGEEIEHLLSDSTKRATDKAVWMQVRDVVKGAFDEMRFTQVTDRMAGLAQQKIEGDPLKVIEMTQKKFGVTEGEGKSILRHLIEGGDLTAYGLFNAVTRTAEDLADYDRASEFEKLGGKLIELPANDWRELAKAA
jgi:hypothetical protein